MKDAGLAIALFCGVLAAWGGFQAAHVVIGVFEQVAHILQ